MVGTPLTPSSPWQWLAIDIETADGTPSDLERSMRLTWAPAPSWKAETIGKRYLDLHAKKLERLALLDESPITVVALRSNVGPIALHACTEHPPRDLHGAVVQGFSDEGAMLAALRAVIEHDVTVDTVIVGHNIVHFDLPKLRHAFLRNGLRPPDAFLCRDQPVFDTMLEYGRRFSIAKRDAMVSLDDLLTEFRIESHKNTADGSMAPELYRDGQHDALIGYAVLDVIAESELFLHMTGQSEFLR